MVFYNMEQQSPEWFALKAGKMSGTSFQPVASGGEPVKKKLALKLAAERITGQRVTDSYNNAHMERGNALEMDARIEYEMQTGTEVTETGFVMANESDGYGMSPDGLIYLNDVLLGGIEIKCKDIHTHLDCVLNGWDKSYKWQIQGAMFVTGCEWWDFVSYNPFYKNPLYIERIERDEALIDKIKAGIEDMESRITAIMEAIK